MDIKVELLDLCPVPMVILNEDDEAIFINESFTRILGYDINDLPDVSHWFARAYPNDEKYRKEQEQVWKAACSKFNQKIDFDAQGRLANVTCKDGSIRNLEIFGANVGNERNLIIFVDITEKERHRQEKEDLISQLNKAFSELKVLRGILPFCSFCKKIRDDEGNWEQVDAYITRHSQASISHGLCPACLKEHYSEEYEEMKRNKKIP